MEGIYLEISNAVDFRPNLKSTSSVIIKRTLIKGGREQSLAVLARLPSEVLLWHREM